MRLLASRREVPAELYEASLIVGATNVAEILDIDRVAPGTIVVDDSAPHAFRSDDGAAAAPRARRYPRDRGRRAARARAAADPGVRPGRARALAQGAASSALVAQADPRLITGCVLSGLLSARFAHLTPTIGLVDRRTALDHYETLEALGFRAPELQLDGTPLDGS